MLCGIKYTLYNICEGSVPPDLLVCGYSVRYNKEILCGRSANVMNKVVGLCPDTVELCLIVNKIRAHRFYR